MEIAESCAPTLAWRVGVKEEVGEVLSEGKADQEMGVFGPPPKIPQKTIVPRDYVLVVEQRTRGIEAKLQGPRTETRTGDYG